MEGCAVGQSNAWGHLGGPHLVPIPKVLIWDGGAGVWWAECNGDTGSASSDNHGSCFWVSPPAGHVASRALGSVQGISAVLALFDVCIPTLVSL